MSITAHATIHCDHPGCPAALWQAAPLPFGRLSSRPLAALRASAVAAGWDVRWDEPANPNDPEQRAVIRHYCPEHATAGALDAVLVDQKKGGE